MKPAEYDTLRIELEGQHESNLFTFRVSASSLRFSGFLEVYEETKPRNRKEGAKEALMDQLPEVEKGDSLDFLDLFPEQHFTQPPPRYSEARLVRSLEEHGIGRPSTYAPIITTIQQRGYVERENRTLYPTHVHCP